MGPFVQTPLLYHLDHYLSSQASQAAGGGLCPPNQPARILWHGGKPTSPDHWPCRYGAPTVLMCTHKSLAPLVKAAKSHWQLWVPGIFTCQLGDGTGELNTMQPGPAGAEFMYFPLPLPCHWLQGQGDSPVSSVKTK